MHAHVTAISLTFLAFWGKKYARDAWGESLPLICLRFTKQIVRIDWPNGTIDMVPVRAGTERGEFTILETLPVPNATITEEIDGGAWLAQTDLEPAA